MGSKVKKFLKISIPILVGLDLLFFLIAENKIENERYFIDKRFHEFKSNISLLKYTDCKKGPIFHFYLYKTCFIRRFANEERNLSYYYYYAGPFPIFLRFMNRVTFEMIDTGLPEFIVYEDGTIEKLNR